MPIGPVNIRCLVTDGVRVVFAGDGIAALTGYPVGEFVQGAVSLPAMFHPDDGDIAEALFGASTADGASNTNFRLQRRDRSVVCVRCTATRRAGPDGIELALALEDARALRADVQDANLVTNFIAMMENTLDYIYFKDRNHVFTGASQTLVKLTDPSEHWSDLIGKTDYDVFPKEFADHYYSLEKKVFEGGVDVAREVQPTLDNAGNRGWVDNRKYPIKDVAGNIVGLFGVARDITAEKLAEDARREALDRLQKLAALVPGVVFQFLLRPNGSMAFPYISEAAREVYGVGPEVAMEDAAFAFRMVHPDDLAQVLASMAQSARDLTPWINEHRLRRADGELRYLYAKATPQRLDDGSVLWHGFISDVTDLAERKRTEADLRIAATAFESQNGMLVTDANEVILKVNHAFTASTGYTAAEAVGNTPRLLSSGRHGPEFFTAMWECVRRTGTWQGEVWNKRKDGEVHPDWVTISEVRGSSGAVTNYVAAVSDMTDRRKLEDQLRHAQKLEAIGQLAGGVAHDFNNLLVVILNYSALALEPMKPDDPRGDYLREVIKAGERAATLTRQLLAFGRKQVLAPQALDLNRIVAAAEKLLQMLVGENIAVVTALGLDVDTVRADPSQVDQVLMNLAINARDAMPHGGTLTVATANATRDEVAVDTLEGLSEAPSFVALSVTDTGIGMDVATVARVFEPFFTTKEPGKGTGLGLSTVYGIAKQSGGTVTVSSVPGQGTTFTVYLPARGADAPVDVGPTHRAPRPSGGLETVLVVEDQEDVLRLTTRVLTRAGYTVLAASNGKEALQLACAHPGEIHLLVTDVMMPKMSGRTVATRLREERPRVLVLYMSGHTNDALGANGERDERTNFLAKPFTVRALTERVRSLLDLEIDDASGGPRGRPEGPR